MKRKRDFPFFLFLFEKWALFSIMKIKNLPFFIIRMHAKKILGALLLTLSFFGTNYVYSNFYKNSEIQFIKTYTSTLYRDHEVLWSNFAVFQSNTDLSWYRIHSLCNGTSRLISRQENISIFQFEISDEKCTNGNFYLKDSKWDILLNTHFSLSIQSYFSLFQAYVDVDSENLEKILSKLKTYKNSLYMYARLQDKSADAGFFRKYFDYHQVVYQSAIIEEILSQRTQKYAIPVPGHILPTRETKLPNSGRPYRADYTYGIHEWWDIDTKLGEPVIALDDGVIVRVVRDFQFEDLNMIEKKQTMMHKDRIKNLDVLRGNQVWLKTSKWDMVFYSHLSQVEENIFEGQRVSKWQKLGNTGITWVPDKDYTDYHLHFELRKNPYNTQKAWKYTFEDYMNWDWYFKGKTASYIKENQYTIFEK